VVKHNGRVLEEAYVTGMEGKECDVVYFPNGVEVNHGDEIIVTNEVVEISE